MTKERLNELRFIEKSIKSIQNDIKKTTDDLQDAKEKVYTDVVKGSIPEHPYIERHVQIKGIDCSSHEKLIKRLRERENELQEKLLDLEKWLDGIEDERLYLIFRMKYRNGLTNKEIADELGYDKSRISQLISGYLKDSPN